MTNLSSDQTAAAADHGGHFRPNAVDSEAALHPGAPFIFSPGTVLLIEADSQESAERHFQAILANDISAKRSMSELSARLFVARAQKTGRYWRYANFAGNPEVAGSRPT